MVKLVTVALACLLLVGAVACEEETSDSEPTATTEVQATEAVESTEEPEPTVADDDPVDDEFRTEAEELCPDVDLDFYDACVDATTSILSGSLPGVMCVNSLTGQWYWATPGATPLPGFDDLRNQPTGLGEPCAEDGFVSVKIVNFP